MANNFNMVAFMDALVESGFSDKQAKGLASAMFELIDSNLVTKNHLDMRMAELRMEMASLKADMIQWMVGLLVVQSGLIAALFKLLH
jgi:hypothetical protein